MWTFSGVRPLYDDNASSATEATRDYVLKTHDEHGKMPLLNVFGGKITINRKLAESALTEIKNYFPKLRVADGKHTFTRRQLVDGAGRLALDLSTAYPFASDRLLVRLVKAYGSIHIRSRRRSVRAISVNYSGGIYLLPCGYGLEYARTAEDIVCRSKLGLRLTDDEVASLQHWMQTGELNT